MDTRGSGKFLRNCFLLLIVMMNYISCFKQYSEPEKVAETDLLVLDNYFYAIQNGDVKETERLLDLGVPVDEKRLGTAALYTASLNGYTDIVKLLIARGADVEIETDEKDRPLGVASRMGHIEIVKLLLDAGAGVDTRQIEDSTALMVAAQGTLLSDDALELLRKKSDRKSKLMLHSLESHTDIMEILIEHGADVNAYSKETAMTPLIGAGINGSLASMDLLLKHGADINQAAYNGGRAIDATIAYDEREAFEYLVKKGAAIEYEFQYFSTISNSLIYVTPLVASADIGDNYYTKRLIELGANVNYKTGDKASSIYAACLRNDPETIRMLLAAGANINEKGPNGDTPLMTAVRNDNYLVVEYLLQSGVDPNQRNDNGETAYSISITTNRYIEIVEMLLRRGVNPDQVIVVYDGKEIKPLEYAKKYNDTLLQEILESFGAKE